MSAGMRHSPRTPVYSQPTLSILVRNRGQAALVRLEPLTNHQNIIPLPLTIYDGDTHLQRHVPHAASRPGPIRRSSTTCTHCITTSAYFGIAYGIIEQSMVMGIWNL